MNDKIKKTIYGILMFLPLILSGIWLFSLYAAYITPPPLGVQQAPISKNKIFALVAFMIGYSIFLGLTYFSKKRSR